MMADVTLPWQYLFEMYVGSYSNVDDNRAFRSFTGVCPQVAEATYVRYSHPTHCTRRKVLPLFQP